MSAITIDGDLVHYEKLGRGRPVILIHGWIGSWRYWVPTMQQLQLKYSVYALDLFGFGDSSKNPVKYGVDRQVDLLNLFVREMGIPKAAIIAHGLGTLVAAEFGRRNPDKTARLLLVSTPLYDPPTVNLADHNPPGAIRPLQAPPLAVSAPIAKHTFDGEATIMNASAIDRAALARAALNLTASGGGASTNTAPTVPNRAPAEVKLSRAEHNPLAEALYGDLQELLSRCFRRNEPEFEKLNVDINKTDPAALMASIATFDSLELLDKFHLLDCPLVFVHGKDDPIIANPKEEVWTYLARTKGEDKLLPIPLSGVRHFPMLENDRFVRLATDFLEKPDISTIEVQERWKRRSR